MFVFMFTDKPYVKMPRRVKQPKMKTSERRLLIEKLVREWASIEF